nr:MAG TPA: hypothetical protein [Caudoviricetes sp.]
MATRLITLSLCPHTTSRNWYILKGRLNAL